MKTPPTSKTYRISVPLTPEVLAKFQRFSDASGLSLGKSIGDWLRDTVSGLDAMTEILEMHKRAPAEAISKIQGLATSLQAVSEEAIANMRKTAPAPARARRKGPAGKEPPLLAARSARVVSPLSGGDRSVDAMRAAAHSPRLVIRGGKSTDTGKGARS